MNYLEALSELIMNKSEVSGKYTINISLREVADVWQRNVIKSRQELRTDTASTLYRTVEEISDDNFVADVINALSALKKQGVISLISSIDLNTLKLDNLISVRVKKEKGFSPELKNINKDIKNKNKKYWIDYTTNRFVLLNETYIINKMQIGRVSDEWFQYVFDNPNKNITIEEIKEKTKKAGGSFIKFLNNIKFKGQLRELFFKQGKRNIIFYNPITEADITNKLINIKKLEKEIKKLKKIN